MMVSPGCISDSKAVGTDLTIASLFTNWWLNISVFNIRSLSPTLVVLLYLFPFGSITKSKGAFISILGYTL